MRRGPIGPPEQRLRTNHQIRISPLRVIGPDGEQVGVVSRDEALRLARESELDLVEISPTASRSSSWNDSTPTSQPKSRSAGSFEYSTPNPP